MTKLTDTDSKRNRNETNYDWGTPDRLNGALLENTVTLVAVSDKYARQVIETVPLNLYSNEIMREIASAVYDYIAKYGKAPGDHLPDLFEKRIAKNDARAELLYAGLQNIHTLQLNGFNAEYAANQLERFVQQQYVKVLTVKLIKATDDGNTDAANAAINDYVQHQPNYGQRDGVRVINAATVKPENYDWLWKGYIARGQFHVLAGKAGLGKSQIALALAAVTTGGGAARSTRGGVARYRRWPGGTRPRKPLDVVIWSGEDTVREALIPRLIAAGADMSRIHIVEGVLDRGKDREFDPARDMPGLAQFVHSLGREVGLIIIDPIVSAVDKDSHNNAETRRSLQPTVNLCHSVNAALLGIHHFTKNSAGHDPLDRVSGSLAFGAVPRMVMAVAKVRSPDTPDHAYVFLRLKTNMGPFGGGFYYTMEPTTIPSKGDQDDQDDEDSKDVETVRIRWTGEFDGEADAIIGAAEHIVKPGELLQELLADGAQLAADVIAMAQDRGFTEKQMQNAASSLGVVRHKLGFEKGWEWSLPAAGTQSAGTKD